MRDGALAPLGGEGEIVEVDETYIGHIKSKPIAKAFHHKMKVLSLVERGGKSRSLVIDRIGPNALVPIVKANLDRETHVMTDEAHSYRYLAHHFAQHSHVNHKREEYVRGEAYTNTVEGFFSIFKRGMRGVYQFCGEKHLHRYLAEFDFRYSNRQALGCDDEARAVRLLQGIVGKRLTYRRTCEA
jgi:hypothetical protein